MREIQRLRSVPSEVHDSATIHPAVNMNWGNPQRFLVAGLVILVLAAVAAIILYRQLPTRVVAAPEEVRQYLRSLPTEDTIQFFHRRLLPGIEMREQGEFESSRGKIYLGLAALAAFGAIGLLLAAIGFAGIARKRR